MLILENASSSFDQFWRKTYKHHFTIFHKRSAFTALFELAIPPGSYVGLTNIRISTFHSCIFVSVLSFFAVGDADDRLGCAISFPRRWRRLPCLCFSAVCNDATAHLSLWASGPRCLQWCHNTATSVGDTANCNTDRLTICLLDLRLSVQCDMKNGSDNVWLCSVHVLMLVPVLFSIPLLGISL